jgi:hypothetical protein
MKKLLATVALAATLLTGHFSGLPAKADSRTLFASAGNHGVIVWKDTDALLTGGKLFEAGINKTNPVMIVPY